ncbi:MAG: sporulation protein YunB [Clostridia bacterium]|nr:sporulation protein YunB [Clostridia bacterium]
MNRLKRLIALILIVSGVLCLVSMYAYTKYLRPKIITISQKFVENEVSNMIDREVKNLMLEEFLSYDKITIISRDANGKVTSVSTNSVLINNFANELDIKIGDLIEENELFENRVYLSSLMGFDLFAGIGPKVPIRFEPISVTHADIMHTFEETAINQTLHTIILSISIDIEILLPFAYSSITVESQMPIAQTLIVGSVPDAYFNKK